MLWLARWKREAAAARLALERCEAQRVRESAAAEASEAGSNPNPHPNRNPNSQPSLPQAREAQLRTELGALRKALTATQRTLDAVLAC